MKWYTTLGGQRYSFKKHALAQRRLRKVERADVEKVLDNHDVSHLDIKGNSCLIGNLDDGRRMRVVAAMEPDGFAIITVIILR